MGLKSIIKALISMRVLSEATAGKPDSNCYANALNNCFGTDHPFGKLGPGGIRISSEARLYIVNSRSNLNKVRYFHSKLH